MADLMDSGSKNAEGSVASAYLTGGLTAAAQYGVGQLDRFIGYEMQKNFNRQARADNIKLMKLGAELNAQQAYRAIAQSTSALKAAGLNPALATSGNFTAQGVSNPSMQPASAPAGGGVPDLANALRVGKEMSLLDAERENLRSQTKANNASANKFDAEAEESRQRSSESEQRTIGVERENLRASDYDKTINENMRAAFRIQAQDPSLSPAEHEFYQALADSTNDYSRGTLEAQREFAMYLNELDEYQKEAVLRVLTKKIAGMQLKDEPTLEALAFAPKTQQNKMVAETADLWSSKKWRDWQRETLGPVQASLLGTEEQVKRHSDFVGMVDDGNYFGAAMYLLPSLLTGLGSAAIYGKMLKGAGKAADKVGDKVTQKDVDRIYDNLPQQTKRVSTPVFKNVNSDRPHPIVAPKPVPSSREVHGELIHDNRQTYNSVRASLGERNTDMLYKRYLNEKHTNETFKQWLSREKPLIK